MKHQGLVHVYTGDGKGKTTASLGLALRAAGQGFNVFMIQYMKGGAYTGEYVAAKNFIPNFEIIQFGRPCVKQQKQLKIQGFYKLSKEDKNKKLFDYVREEIECGTCRYCFLNDDIQKDYVEEAFKKTLEIVMSGNYPLVILDEINTAMSLNILNIELVLNLMANKPKHVEIIMTGRGAPLEIREMADLVSEIKAEKHYFDKGVPARRGIEY